jgi:predicted acylesterase/phospholipase RssA
MGLLPPDGGPRPEDSGPMLPPEPEGDESGVPIYPPGQELPPTLDGDGLPPDLDLCTELADRCLELFNDFARASLAEGDAQLIASVDPQNLCASVLTDDTEFTARPDPGMSFPNRTPQHRLLFRDLDITKRIKSWTNHEIKFTIPANSKTGFLRLQTLVNEPSHVLGRTLANLCGVPGGPAAGAGLSPSPRTMITIVRAPVIDEFSIVGGSGAVVTTEACTAVTLRWAVSLEDWPSGLPLPVGSGLQVELRDASGTVVFQTNEASGRFDDNPSEDIAYRLHVESLAESCFRDACRCGHADAGPLEVRREHRLHVEPLEPRVAKTVAGRSGMIWVRLSCPAPVEGAVVSLRSSDSAVMQLPDSVRVLPGETAAPVQFGTDRVHPGAVVITAERAGHIPGQLRYEVLANLTAIVLSGGGAKGSFQAGALMYLRQIWNEIRPTIICGTSVGSINSLALAEATDSSGIDKIESIWLGLEYDDDMFVPSAPFKEASDLLNVDLPKVLFEKADLNIGPLILGLLGIQSEGAGVAIGIGAVLNGITPFLVPLAITAGVSIDRVLDKLKTASSVYDLQPTEDIILGRVNFSAIASSGMTLRLATVALEDGELYYVTEQSRLIRGNAFQPIFDEAITTTYPLVVGAMASAAIPAIFPAKQIDTASTSFHYVDGGVREVVPQQAAVDLGAQLIFEIAVSPFTPEPAPKPSAEDLHPSFGDNGRIFDIAFRGLDLQSNEVTIGDIVPRSGFCDDRERILIMPRELIHDTQEIEPGLIRINMAYGWLRGFEADQLRRGNINGLQMLLWNLWSDDVAVERKRCHILERFITQQYWYYGHLFRHDLLEALRMSKNRIAELIVERFDFFGAAGFPPKLDQVALLDQVVFASHGVLDWCGTWEVHRNQKSDELSERQVPDRTFLAGIDLWTPQMGVRFVGPGVEPMLEASILARYPIPTVVEQALRAR